MGVVALSMVVMLRVTAEADPLAREDLAFALSVVLLDLLMMVSERNAVSQVVGFMSLENGLVLAVTGAKSMPLVVEMRRLLGADRLHRDRHLPVPHSRTLEDSARSCWSLSAPRPKTKRRSLDSSTGCARVHNRDRSYSST
jgi:hypothetical protein